MPQGARRSKQSTPDQPQHRFFTDTKHRRSFPDAECQALALVLGLVLLGPFSWLSAIRIARSIPLMTEIS